MSTSQQTAHAIEVQVGRRLLLLACTQTKRHASGPMPALRRYDGPSFRVLRKWQSANPDEAARLDILILSAKFGLITADAPITDYDRRLTPERADELGQAVSAGLTAFVTQHGPYTATLVHLGKDYRPAIVLEQIQDPAFGHITFTSGGIGTRLGQLKRWLAATSEIILSNL